MALIVPNSGEVEMLQRILNGTDKLVLHLFSGNHIPHEEDFANTYDEVGGSGYSSKNLTETWNIAGDGAGTTEATYSQVSFDFTGAATVYGYFVTDSTGSKLMWAERFTDSPYNIPGGGGSVKISPRVQLD